MDPILIENYLENKDKKIDLYKADVFSLGITFFDVVTKKVFRYNNKIPIL